VPTAVTDARTTASVVGRPARRDLVGSQRRWHGLFRHRFTSLLHHGPYNPMQ
jgi:hypothetical protein